MKIILDREEIQTLLEDKVYSSYVNDEEFEVGIENYFDLPYEITFTIRLKKDVEVEEELQAVRD